MLIKKYQHPDGKLFRFTPEQMAQFERESKQPSVPGTNVNSNRTVGTTARRAGVEATRTRQRRKRVEDSKPVGEMRTPVPVATRQDPVTKEVVVTKWGNAGSNSSGAMSGRDPMLGTIFDWTVGAKGIDALGKTALWNVAKYAPTTQLGNWGRNYFVNQAFKQGLRKPIQFGMGETLLPQVRTKIGDVEINNPGLNYRVGTKEIVEDFQNSGIVRAGKVNSQKPNRAGRFLLTKETFQTPMFEQGSLWYQPSEKMNGLLTTSEPLVVANKYASPVANKGIFTIEGKTFVNDFGGRRIPAEGQILNKSNTAAYIWEPGYGYRQVVEKPSTSLAFFEKNPATYISTADIGTTAKQGTTALSQEEIQKAFEGARQWHLKRINSEGWKARASRAGFTDEEIPQLQKQLLDQIKRLTLTTEKSVFGKNASISNAGNARLAARYMQYYDPVTKQIRMGISLESPNISYNEAFRNFVHEFGHGATFGLNGTETSGVKGLLANKFPLINRLVKYNKSLYPEISEKSVSEVLPEVNEYWASQTIDNPKLLSYFAEPTEMQSRGYEFLLNSAAAKNRLKRTMNVEPTDLEVMDKAVKYGGPSSNMFRKLAGEQGASNFIHNALGFSVPLGLGYGLYNNNDQQQQLQYQKQGGRMDILKFL